MGTYSIDERISIDIAPRPRSRKKCSVCVIGTSRCSFLRSCRFQWDDYRKWITIWLNHNDRFSRLVNRVRYRQQSRYIANINQFQERTRSSGTGELRYPRIEYSRG